MRPPYFENLSVFFHLIYKKTFPKKNNILKLLKEIDVLIQKRKIDVNCPK